MKYVWIKIIFEVAFIGIINFVLKCKTHYFYFSCIWVNLIKDMRLFMFGSIFVTLFPQTLISSWFLFFKMRLITALNLHSSPWVITWISLVTWPLTLGKSIKFLNLQHEMALWLQFLQIFYHIFIFFSSPNGVHTPQN